MKRPTFRLREDKHRKLMAKLTLNGESFQGFGEYVVDLYLNDKLQIKKESEEMKVTTIESFNDFVKFVVSCGLKVEVANLRWEKWFKDQQEEKEFFEVNDSFKIMFDNNEIYADWQEKFKKESINMNKKKEYVEGIKEYLESNKIIDLSTCEDDGISYNNILDELDNQNIAYSTENYYDDYVQLKSLPSMSIYCDQFYIKQ